MNESAAVLEEPTAELERAEAEVGVEGDKDKGSDGAAAKKNEE